MAVSDSATLDVLRILEGKPQVTQREMARALGISLGKANYCLCALLAKGFVKVKNFHNSTTKRKYAYVLTPEGIAAKADLTRHFLIRTRAEYELLLREVERPAAN